jgi:hypothetical protein
LDLLTQLKTTSNYSIIVYFHTLQITMAHIKSYQPSLVIS